ncbi:hypothetical protein CB0940_02344 [Cercospora beticola]|uniref:Zn(2)-C6 fungal-type domain-containing protein n=1 Tax=Cercospora beticola TaxID=122368 RepID=A0A2G5I1X2_CERBT|nr:hypothetical protein CB0940_02344 [Cercospora beticola]PIA98748.1 hypothetical protein CB0940_02344 [Cercospora beticola]WPA99474.1 hypothetical protein RHO25_004091 [Cercospora beticola]
MAMASFTASNYQDSPPQGNPHSRSQIGIAKLKNSCDACTAAKVGCTKEKPSCVRCVKRRCSCVYSTTKRIRRVPLPKGSTSTSKPTANEERPHNGPVNSAGHTPENITVALPQQDSSHDSVFFPTPVSNDQAPNWMLSATTTSDTFANLLTPDESSLFDLPGSVAADWESEFDCLGSLAVQEACQGSGMTESSIFDLGDSILSGYSSAGTDAGVSGRESSAGLLPSSSRTSIFGDTHMVQEDTAMDIFGPNCGTSSSENAPDMSSSAPEVRSESSCSCLVRVSALLARISPPSRVHNSDSRTKTKGTRSQLELDHVLEQNTKALELAKECLRCSCVTDGYTLVLLSLAVLAVLNRYTTAAADILGGSADADALGRRQTPQAAVTQSSITEAERHKASRRILSQLTALQSIQRDLSERFKGVNEAEAGLQCSKRPLNDRSREGAVALLSLPALAAPVPSVVIQQLHTAIRSRLHELSRAIIQSIRGR